MCRVQMAMFITWDVQTLLNCVCTLMYSFGFSFLICPAGWPVGSDWLLQGVTPIQVQAHYFNQHQPSGLLTPRPVAFTAGLGAGSANAGAAAGSSPPAGGQQLQRLLTALRRRQCRSRPRALFRRPLGPRISAWRSWSWGGRWCFNPLYVLLKAVRSACTCNLKESGFIWYIHLYLQLHFHVEVLVHWCCPREESK